MGTQKRERQKANRAQKIEDQRKQEQRDLTKDRGLIIGLIALAVAAAIALWVFFGDSDEEPETPDITTAEPAIPEQPLPTTVTDPSTDTEPPADTEAPSETGPVDTETTTEPSDEDSTETTASQ